MLKRSKMIHAPAVVFFLFIALAPPIDSPKKELRFRDFPLGRCITFRNGVRANRVSICLPQPQ
jgi:hypothetical protein